MTWGQKRKMTYICIIGGIILLVLFAFLYPMLNKAPTCADGKQNGREVGIDCGGSCTKLCSSQVKEPIVLWSRAFEVSDNHVYNLLAYVENQNIGATANNVSYEFRMYDENNIFIGKEEGRTIIMPNSRTPIFVTGVVTGNRVPKRTTFTFTSVPVWLRVPPQLDNLALRLSNRSMTNETTVPRLSVDISNDTSYVVNDLDVMAILYDKNDNAFAVSKTLVRGLARGQKKTLFFTWPRAFAEAPTRIEIIPVLDLFKVHK